MFAEIGVSIFAAVVEDEETTQKVADNLGFPVAYGVTRAQGDLLGSWWDEKNDFIQPSEFVLSRKGKVVMSTYSSTPIGRMDPAETLTLLTMITKRSKPAQT